MDQIFSIALLAGLVVAMPAALLCYYRDTIPPGPYWLAIGCLFAMPFLGWFVALFVALKDWGYNAERSDQ